MSEVKKDNMQLFLLGLGSIFLIPIIFFFTATLATFGGAFVGWVVGLFFSNTILGIFTQFGIHDIAMWQMGAFLGFVGSFFRTVSTNPTKKE